jgi:hypothetical protein
LWWRHERFSRRVLADPVALGPCFQEQRDQAEARWLADPPGAAEAFSQGDALLAEWTAAVCRRRLRDVRPWWVRLYWARRNRWAGL